MKIKYLQIIFVFFGLCLAGLYAQVDQSLLDELKVSKDDTSKVRMLLEISKSQISEDQELALKYSKDAIKLSQQLKFNSGLGDALHLTGNVYLTYGKNQEAIGFYEQALATRELIKDSKGLAGTLNNIGIAYLNLGQLSITETYLTKSLNLKKKLGDKNGVASTLNNLGNLNMDRANYSKALENYLASLTIEEELDNKYGMANTINNIGLIHHLQNKFDEALENFNESARLRTIIDDKNGLAESYDNIGVLYSDKGDLDTALFFYKRSLKILEEINNEHRIARVYNNIGMIQKKMGNTKEAIKDLQRSLEIRTKLDDKVGIIESYISVSQIYEEIGELEMSLEHASKALELSEKVGYPSGQQDAYKTLSDIYYKKSSFKNAYDYYKLFSELKDQLLDEESKNKLADLQSSYELEKRDREISDLKKDNEIKELRHQKDSNEKILIYGILAVVVLVLTLTGFAFLRIRKANTIIAEQKEEVELKNKEITDSITYAKRIQDAILPPDRLIKSSLADSFVLYKPKDIVAGDFYWMEKVEDQIILAAADCTGHGVPGAMVSVVCHNSLNRSVREFGLTEPNEILDKTRELVIETFEKSHEEVKDGMDIAICNIDLNKNRLKFSGANNGLYHISGGTLSELKPDKQPIGKYAEATPFSTHELKLAEGDVLYIYTDGYADQFGGPKGKKFKYKPFKELLMSNYQLPMMEQVELIDQAFEAWKGGLEQVDDVCIIGVRV